MGALIGTVIQLTMLAVRLMVVAVIWMVRLTVMLVAMTIGALSSARS